MAKKVTDPTQKTRSKIVRQKEKFQVWRNVATATAANASEITGTEARLTTLQGVITEVDTILSEQAAFQASKQIVHTVFLTRSVQLPTHPEVAARLSGHLNRYLPIALEIQGLHGIR